MSVGNFSDFVKGRGLPINIDEAKLKEHEIERSSKRIDLFLKADSDEVPENIVKLILPSSGRVSNPKEFIRNANTFIEALLLKSSDEKLPNDQKIKLLALGVSLYQLAENQKLPEDDLEQLQQKILALGTMELSPGTAFSKDFDPSVLKFFEDTNVGLQLSKTHKISLGSPKPIDQLYRKSSSSSFGGDSDEFEMVDLKEIPTPKKSSGLLQRIQDKVDQFVITNLSPQTAKEMQQALKHVQTDEEYVAQKEIFDQASIVAFHGYLNDDLATTKQQFNKDYVRSGYSISDGSTKIEKQWNENSTSAEGLAIIENEILKTEDDRQWEGALLTLINQSTGNASLNGIHSQINEYLANTTQSSLSIDQLFYQPTIVRDKNGKIERIDLELNVTFHKIQQTDDPKQRGKRLVSIQPSVLKGNVTFSVKKLGTEFYAENLNVQLKVNPFPPSASEHLTQSLKNLIVNIDELIQRTDYQSEDIKNTIRTLANSIDNLKKFQNQLTDSQKQDLDIASNILKDFITYHEIIMN